MFDNPAFNTPIDPGIYQPPSDPQPHQPKTWMGKHPLLTGALGGLGVAGLAALLGDDVDWKQALLMGPGLGLAAGMMHQKNQKQKQPQVYKNGKPRQGKIAPMAGNGQLPGLGAASNYTPQDIPPTMFGQPPMMGDRLM